ncbi:MAG: peroxiredoxin [bacterium]|nr:peroxiredoxin [bacterium]
MTELKPGDKAPEFTLPASNGTEVSLMDYRGTHYVVLYFYPKDATPGCTQEAIAFRDLQHEFQLAGAVILGVSTDDVASHGRFATEHNLTFPLLSDVDGKVTEKYGVMAKRRGKSAGPRAARVTFVIDKEGVIRRIYRNIKLECHADEVLTYVHGLKLEEEVAERV